MSKDTPANHRISRPKTNRPPRHRRNRTKTEDIRALPSSRGDLDRFRDLALRSQADFENFRKRAAREKEDAIKYANAAFLER